MNFRKSTLLKAALSALHYTGADRLLAPLTRGDGVVFMLHHVRPEPTNAFEPNRILKVTPDFLDSVVREVIDNGFEILSLDGVHERLSSGEAHDRPFACFTFDDGYKDNRDYAYPVFKRYGAPFNIYVPTDYPDGRGELWWLALEEIIRRSHSIVVQRDGAIVRYPCGTVREKDASFDDVYWWLRGLPEDRARKVVAELAAAAGVDIAAMCRDLIMTWDEIRALARDPLVTIGAHTRRHYALAKLDEDVVRDEIVGSVQRIEKELGRPCTHFSFPYGDPASAGPREFEIAATLGIKTAVTTRKGLIHRSALPGRTALPRVSLNGDYQQMRYVKVLLTGAPFAFMNAVSRARPGTV